MKFLKKISLFLLVSCFAIGCGGTGGENRQVLDNTGNMENNTSPVVSSRNIGPDSQCEFEGICIDSGIDESGNGVLESIDDDKPAVFCYGDQGGSGYNSLVRLDSEPTGDYCTYGGIKISDLMDENRNERLDSNEVSTARYVYCSGTLKGWDSITVLYTADQLNSGDVIVTGEIYTASAGVTNTAYYAYFQEGFINAPVYITYDIFGSDNWGYWKISLNRDTLLMSVEYKDRDVSVNPATWTMSPDKCIVNTF